MSVISQVPSSTLCSLHVRPQRTTCPQCTVYTTPMLSYSTPSYPVLPHPNLSYPILSYPILPHPNLSHPILPFPTLSYTILPYPTLFYSILPYLIPIPSYRNTVWSLSSFNLNSKGRSAICCVILPWSAVCSRLGFLCEHVLHSIKIIKTTPWMLCDQ